MKIGIVGSGAMGSVYGALLADAGNELWLLDRWQEHIEAMRTQGLRCEGASGDRTVAVHATTDPADAGPCELVIVATKVMDIEDAVRVAAPMIGPDSLVLAIQNGLGNVERLQKVLSADNLLFGIAGGFGAEILAPGHVHHNGMEAINLAELSGGVSARLERVGAVWREAGFTVKLYEDLWPVVWSKLVANVAFSAICSPMTTRWDGCAILPARSRTRGLRCIRTCAPGAARRSIRSRAASSPRAPSSAS